MNLPKIAILIVTLPAFSLLRAERLSSKSYEVPVVFEQNQGQASPDIRFVARARNYALGLTNHETIFRFPGRQSEIRMRLAGSNSKSPLAPDGPLQGHTNYFRGADRSKWISNVRHYERVIRTGVYAGIDQIYYGNKGNLEHDLIVAPGGDPSQIAFEFEGTGHIRVDSDGTLSLEGAEGVLLQHKPVAYQNAG